MRANYWATPTLHAIYHMAVFPLKVNSTFSNKFPFSNAAATRSLSLSCLFTCVSEACEPSETFICIREKDGERKPFGSVLSSQTNADDDVQNFA